MFTGIIAELNPLHKGHQSLLHYAGSLPNSEGVIVILSSNFTQRGSPSITDKFLRSSAAIKAGADIVIELPFLYACSAGQDFARGAVNILGRLGFVSRIAFGMETPEYDINPAIKVISDEPEQYRNALRNELMQGASYPKALSLALEHAIPGSYNFITKPNNMLALSYMLEIRRQGYDIEALPVKRTGDFRSSVIREDIIANSHMMPKYSQDIIAMAKRKGRLCNEERLWPLLQCVFIRSEPEELREIYGIDEGIEGLFLKHWRASRGLDDFIGRCVCSRYTRAHIRRRLVYILLGLKRRNVREAMNDGVPYARVLAFNSKGRQILRKYADGSGIPIITRLKDANDKAGKYFAQTEYKVSQLYELLMDNPDMKRETHKVLQFP